MKLKETFLTATRGLQTHRMRSGLTILGIVIGITAIILVTSIGRGVQDIVISQVASLGSRTIAVVPGKEPTGPADPSVIESFFGDSLKARELEALKKKSNVPHAEEIMPAVFGIETISYQGETFRPMILGSTELVSDIFDIQPESGVFITQDDILSRSEVAVIGIDVKEELFGESNAIGEKIRVKGRNLRVIGVLPPKGQVIFFNFDEIVITPYTTAQHYIFGIKHFNRIIIQVDNEANVPATVHDIELTLRELHNITDPENDDFFVGTQAEIADTLEAVTGALTAFLGAVAAISLLVGGIGIMNIMLVSVAERKKEIGIRKAVGATRKNILLQFLFESAILTGTGGALGIFFGAVLSFGISVALTQFLEIQWSFILPLSSAAFGITVSVAIGIIFGLYPAWRASKQNPIETLYH